MSIKFSTGATNLQSLILKEKGCKTLPYQMCITWLSKQNKVEYKVDLLTESPENAINL